MIILNEREYAENCLRNNYAGEDLYFTLSVLSRYYYSCDYSKEKIENSLIDFLKTQKKFWYGNKNYWLGVASSLAAKAGKHPLVEIEGVSIKELELQEIEFIRNRPLEKLAFVLLCLTKYNQLKYLEKDVWLNYDLKTIFRMARIPCSKKERLLKIHELYKLGLIQLSNRIDCTSFKITYLFDDDDEELFIRDFRELGREYLKYRGGNYTRCRECGLLIKDNKNHTKRYCDACRQPKRMIVKSLTCADCGKVFEVNSKNNNSKRCPQCQHEYIKAKDRLRKRQNSTRRGISHEHQPLSQTL